MAKRGEPKPSPPKRFWVPPNITALKEHGTLIVEEMRKSFNKQRGK